MNGSTWWASHLRQLDRLQRRLLLGRRQLDVHQLAGDGLAQAGQHGLEQHERLALVLVQRIALAVGAEADHLAQVLERDEVLAPQMVERLQQHHLLDLPEVAPAELGGLLRSAFVVDLLDEALLDLLVGDAFLGGPLVDRQVDAEDAVDGFRAAPPCPTARRRPSRGCACAPAR